MIFTPTRVEGVFVIELEPLTDERGFFARSFCRREFEQHGLNPCVEQCNVSLSHAVGTLRGLHFQLAPHEEAKLVRCTRGALWDVALDLRPRSPSYLKWFAVELSATRRNMLYVPEGCAHGFQTLEPETEVAYQLSAAYEPTAQAGVRWDDSAFGIEWPLPDDPLLSDRDRGWPDYDVRSRGT